MTLTVDSKKCASCGEVLVPKSGELGARTGNYCGDLDYGHGESCCDCFDVSFGVGIEHVNRNRAARGLGPLPPRKEQS